MSEAVTRPAANGTDHQAVCGTDNEPTARRCIKCRETKQLSEFAKDRWKPQGRRSVCASCQGGLRPRVGLHPPLPRIRSLSGRRTLHRPAAHRGTRRRVLPLRYVACSSVWTTSGMRPSRWPPHPREHRPVLPQVQPAQAVGRRRASDQGPPSARQGDAMNGGLWSGPGPDHRPDRALSEWAVDKMVFGLPEDQACDPRKIWTECLRIAMSAYRRGWTRTEFVAEMTKCEKKNPRTRRRRWTEHRLWAQLRSYNSSDKAAFTALDKAWDAAAENLNGVGMRTKEEIRDDAVELAFRWADRITDGVDSLTEVEAAVLGYVASETERRGMMRVTCPARAVAEYAKVSAMTASRTLSTLTGKGLLVRHSKGRPGKEGNRRAAIYGLVDPETLRQRNTDSACQSS